MFYTISSASHFLDIATFGFGKKCIYLKFMPMRPYDHKCAIIPRVKSKICERLIILKNYKISEKLPHHYTSERFLALIIA